MTDNSEPFSIYQHFQHRAYRLVRSSPMRWYRSIMPFIRPPMMEHGLQSLSANHHIGISTLSLVPCQHRGTHLTFTYVVWIVFQCVVDVKPWREICLRAALPLSVILARFRSPGWMAPFSLLPALCVSRTFGNASTLLTRLMGTVCGTRASSGVMQAGGKLCVAAPLGVKVRTYIWSRCYVVEIVVIIVVILTSHHLVAKLMLTFNLFARIYLEMGRKPSDKKGLRSRTKNECEDRHTYICMYVAKAICGNEIGWRDSDSSEHK